MKPVRFYLNGGLEEKDIKKMWVGALELIQNFGLRVPHNGIKDLISNFNGARIAGDIITFNSDLVDDALKHQDYGDFPKDVGSENPGIVAGAYVKNVIDLESGEIRPATMRDLIDYTKVCDSYNFYGPPCVRPNDEPVELQRILMYKTSYEYSRVHAHGILDVAGWLNPMEARFGKEMADAANKDFRVDLWLISPFLAPKEGLDILYEFKDEAVDMNVATMPVVGTTGPINMIDSYIQSLAELFSALTLLHLINETKSEKGRVRCVAVDSIRAYPFDMRYAAFVYGSAEDLLGTLYQAQLNRFFKIPLVAKSLLTTGKHPDSHAAGEKAAHTMAAVLVGAKVFANAGLLSVDEIFSVQQLIIDYEIVQYCMRVARGDDFNEDLSALDTIREVGHNGTFLDHDTTVRDFRKALWDPEVFIHPTLQQWTEQGSKGPVQIAKEIALKKIKEHTYRVDKDKQVELNKIFERAKKDLLKE
jgi:trimethylamine--corrinoid protein Co-methyltransferase